MAENFCELPDIADLFVKKRAVFEMDNWMVPEYAVIFVLDILSTIDNNSFRGMDCRRPEFWLTRFEHRRCIAAELGYSVNCQTNK